MVWSPKGADCGTGTLVGRFGNDVALIVCGG